jgi:tetratricopeptide (TPR) repeat protein
MKKLMPPFCFLIFMLLIAIGTSVAQKTNTDSMLLKIAAEKDDDTRVDLLLEFFGTTQDSDPVVDMQNAQKLLLQSQKNNDKISEAFALGEMGYNYWSFGNTVKHLEYDLKALMIAEETGNKKVIALSKNFLAHNYSFTSNIDFRKAVDLYLGSEQAAIEGNSQILQSWAMMNLGQTFLLMGKPDSALMYTQRTYELITRINYTQYLSYVLAQFGKLHDKMGNAELAVNYYTLAIKEAVKSNSPRFLGDGYTKLAECYTKINKVDSATLYARKAIFSVHNTAYEYLVSIEPAKLLLDIYRNKNSDSAMKYSELYRIANDSLNNSRNIQQAQALTFENDLRQQELTTEKIKSEEQRKQNIQYALIALGIIIFIILFLMLSRRHITNTKLIQFLGVVGLLLVFEFLNLLLHPFLERITHHSPVLMLLALVCIAALLVPLHHKLEHWATHKLVEKNKQIRLAAAKKTIEQLEKNIS